MFNRIFVIILFVLIYAHSSQILLAELPELEKKATKELEYLDFPPRHDWIPARKTSTNAHIYDVLIIGAGQTGITHAFALQREKVTNIILLDEQEENNEGSWLSHARMETLRTPKYTIGPDCDIPSLTVRAWYEAKYGEEAWNQIKYVPRLDWADYLKWLRNFLKLPVVNNTKVGTIKWSELEKCFVVPATTNGENQIVYARKIILATGLQGSGEWTVPEHIKKNIDRDRYYHTSDKIDFDSFKGKKVGILGGGPCAFDNALICCQHGAKEVHMYFKRPQLVNLHVFLWGEFVGFLRHFPDLPDQNKWDFIAKMYEIGQPPTPQAVAAVRAEKNIIMHFDSPWIDSKMTGNAPTVITPQSEESLDVIIIATGWITDLNLRDELSEFHDKIALWSDKFTPPSHQLYEALLRAPYLGKGFNFTEKVPGTAPYLNSIFNSTGGALISNGFCAGTGISGMRYSVKALVYEVVSQLFVEDKEYYYYTLDTYDNYLFEN
jgi:cation diffusion facilitator CzcD-associated flavoprotein CzcO